MSETEGPADSLEASRTGGLNRRNEKQSPSKDALPPTLRRPPPRTLRDPSHALLAYRAGRARSAACLQRCLSRGRRGRQDGLLWKSACVFCAQFVGTNDREIDRQIFSLPGRVSRKA